MVGKTTIFLIAVVADDETTVLTETRLNASADSGYLRREGGCSASESVVERTARQI